MIKFTAVTVGLTVGNPDDELCAAAEASRADAAELQSAANELTTLIQDPSFIGSDDPTALNEWGSTLRDLSESSLAFYELGTTETKGEDVNADFVALADFVNKYTMTLADTAASASTPAGFLADVSALFNDPAVKDVTTAAPTAAAHVGAYIGERCGISG